MHRDAEVGELALDQARGEFEGLGTHLLLRGGRILEQGQRRQGRVRQILEQRLLPFAHDAFGLGDLDHRRHDDNGLPLLVAFARELDRMLALLERGGADLAIAPLLAPFAHVGNAALRCRRRCAP